MTGLSTGENSVIGDSTATRDAMHKIVASMRTLGAAHLDVAAP
jgi:hypothetical protein